MKEAHCWTGHPSPPLIIVTYKSPSQVEILLYLFEPPVYVGGVHLSCGVGWLLSFVVLCASWDFPFVTWMACLTKWGFIGNVRK
jgi:hypothetical protein